MLKFNELKFQGPYLDKKKYTKKKQIALAGRSNVGKSSLINHLCQNKKMARVSSTPGKTQSILCFQIDETNDYLVDLPGYGFAKVPTKIKETFSKDIEQYLQEQKETLYILFLLDIRHLPTEQDKLLFEWLNQLNIDHIIIFTKCDKVKESELFQRSEKILHSFSSTKPESFIHYTTKKRLSRKILIQKINQKLYGTDS